MPRHDARVLFIHQQIAALKNQLKALGGDLIVKIGKPGTVLKELTRTYQLEAVYTNHDYEPYATNRDAQVQKWCDSEKIKFKSFKDQCIFEKNEVVSDVGKPYTVFTPYKKKWLKNLKPSDLKLYANESVAGNYLKVKTQSVMPTLKEIGFESFDFTFPPKVPKTPMLSEYEDKRNFPALEDGTSKMGIHFRFGTVSARGSKNRSKAF